MNIIEKYYNLLNKFYQNNIDILLNIQPLFDGKTLLSHLGLKKGPQVGKLLENQLRWQMRNLNGTSEECLNYLKTLI